MPHQPVRTLILLSTVLVCVLTTPAAAYIGPGAGLSAIGALLAVLYAMSDFGAVSILRYDSFTRVIYQSYRLSFERAGAAALGVVLILVMVILILIEGRMRRRADE